jgi:hypothetical protein
MNTLEWDEQVTVITSTGEMGIRYAKADREGIIYEFSMHGTTIQSMLPVEFWAPVFSTPVANCRIDFIEGKLVVLCGLGVPKDPMGNMVLMKVQSRPHYSSRRLAIVIKHIRTILAGLGLRTDRNIMPGFSRN